MSERPILLFMLILGAIAVVAMIVGAVLASKDYSSAGAFSIGAACVGVLGTLAGERYRDTHPRHDE